MKTQATTGMTIEDQPMASAQMMIAVAIVGLLVAIAAPFILVA